MRLKNLFSALFALVALQLQIFAQAPTFIQDSLDTYVNRALSQWQIPGVAVCVVKDGKVTVMKGYGVQELGKPTPVDENTLFMIGSNTKAFTGTALAMLENDGKCSLNDKVQKWLPNFTMKDPWVAKEVNLTDLLCHRLGMETFQGDFMYWTSNLTNKQVLEKFGKLTPTHGLRSKWGYTNAGFLAAGECVQSISGKTWASFLQERIFSPLGMNRTLALSSDASKATNISKAHTIADGKLKVIAYGNIDNLAPAGSISSSIQDMSHWVMAQLDSGRYAGKEVLPLRVIQKTRYPQSIVGRTRRPFNNTHYSLYALGWGLQDYEGTEIVSHTGGVNGFVTSVTLLPEQKLGIIILTNTDQNNFYEALKWEIMDAYLGLPYRNYSQWYLERTQQGQATEAAEIKQWCDSAAMNLKPVLPLAAFIGRYEHEAYGYLNIIQNGNQLKMTFEHHPDLTGKLESLGGNRFLCTYEDPTSGFGTKVIPFKIEGKQVKSLTLSVADFIEFTTYEFVKK